MKKVSLYTTRLIALVFVLLIFIPAYGSAGKPVDIWLSTTDEVSVEAIRVSCVNDSYYFFLPGNMDLTNYKLYFDADSAYINDIFAASGEISAATLLSEEPVNITLNSADSSRSVSVSVLSGSRIPSVFITTESGTLKKVHKSKENKEAGAITVCNEDGDIIFDGNLKHIKIRGNASVDYKKKNYAIKLEEGANLFGMGKAKKWVLLGNYLDKSRIRNQFTFDMARYAGLAYTPETRQVALYINNNYMGVFLLSEKIEVDDDRVDIFDLEKATEDMNEEDLDTYPVVKKQIPGSGRYKGYKIPDEPDDCTGGYIVEFEHLGEKYSSEPSAYYTRHGMCLVIQSPEYCSEKQAAYISCFMQAFENAIFAKDGKDPETGKHYSEIVDFDSLVNKYLINEVSKNYDSNMSSEYFYKPEDDASTKAFAGPVWDLDNTYGDYSRKDNQRVLSPEGLIAAKGGGQDYWWPALYNHDDFRQAVMSRYSSTFIPALEILLGLKEETDVLKSLDTYTEKIRESLVMEYALYPSMKLPQGTVQTGSNIQENIDYLTNYITRRMDYLSGEWLSKAAD